MDSIVCSVALSDTVTASKCDRTRLSFSDKTVQTENSNAYRAARFIVERYGLPGADISVGNNIPSGLGLGGSSADCAGVILALDSLYGLNMSEREMADIALMFGSDTAYMLHGGFARMQGRGEIITGFDSDYRRDVLIAYNGTVDTARCFACFDSENFVGAVTDCDKLLSILSGKDPGGAESMFYNALTPAATLLNPMIQGVFDMMRDYHCVMTGSGAGVVVFGANERAAQLLSSAGYDVIKTAIVR